MMCRQFALLVILVLLDACALLPSSGQKDKLIEEHQPVVPDADGGLTVQPVNITEQVSNAPSQEPSQDKQVDSWLKLAQAGDAQAQYELGKYYAEQGALVDAVSNLAAAANQGVAAAPFVLASIYADAATSMYDLKQSYHWALVSAENGDTNSMVLLHHIIPMMKKKNLGYLLTTDTQNLTALDWLRRASKLGNPDAQYLLGTLYETGTDTVPRNLSRALQLYKKSAQQNHPQAQFALGMMYYHGQNLSSNYQEAFICFLKAAKQNHAGAQYQIGAMYYTGQVSGITDTELPSWYQVYIGRHRLQQHTSVINRNKMAYLWFGLANQRDHEEAEQMQLIVSHILDKEQVDVLNALIDSWPSHSS